MGSVIIIYQYLLASIDKDYDRVKTIKESDRGCVLLVRHKQSGTRFIFRHYQGNGEVYKKLLTISCPNLPKILEVGICGGMVAVLEEYIQGDSLDYILEISSLSNSQASNITRQICNALYCLHSMDAVHRDVKPENVIMDGDRAVLIDFDASRIYKDELNQDTQVLGTTGYAAPEQYGIAQSDIRADIYSLGVLLNIMLTGKHPSIELSGGKLGHIVQKCTMVNPRKRYKSVLYLMEAL